jgi:hypothetical protein
MLQVAACEHTTQTQDFLFTDYYSSVAPFVMPELEWDFRLEKVVSINVSGHKYGLVSSSTMSHSAVLSSCFVQRIPQYLHRRQ